MVNNLSMKIGLGVYCARLMVPNDFYERSRIDIGIKSSEQQLEVTPAVGTRRPAWAGGYSARPPFSATC
jgi:hypothetical protein